MSEERATESTPLVAVRKSILSDDLCWQYSRKCKKRWAIANVALFMMLNGIEYAAFLPSLQNYLKSRFNDESFYYGLCISGFSMSSLIFCPIFGYFNDWTRNTKLLVLICALCEVIGNTIYLVQIQSLVFLSRIITGAGSAAGPLLYAEMNRVNDHKELTAVMALLTVARQLGLFLGPAINTCNRFFSIEISGPFAITKDTAPGFMLAIIWILFMIIFGCTFFNGDSYMDSNHMSRTKSIQSASASSSRSNTLQPHLSDLEDSSTSMHRSSSQRSQRSQSILSQVIRGERIPYEVYLYELSQPPVIAILAVFLFNLFTMISIESLFPIIGSLYFSLSVDQNSYIYAIAGAVCLFSCFLIGAISKRVESRKIIFIGLIVGALSMTWFGVGLWQSEPLSGWAWFHFAGSASVYTITNVFVAIPILTIYANLLSEETQGFGAGFRRSMMNIGAIVGPLWSGAMCSVNNCRILWLMVVNAGVTLFSLLLFTASYGKMNPKPMKQMQKEQNSTGGET